jgi:outer membrane protein
MKKLVMFIACGLLAGTVLAQTTAPKIGYVNSALLLQSMPERVNADSSVAKYARSFQEQIDIMMKDYQAKVQTYQGSEKTMTDAMKEVKQKELEDLGNRIQSTQQSAQEKLQQKKQDVYSPILEKAEKAIKEVAKDKKYDFIFDISAGGVMLYGNEAYDITKEVKTKLGLK